MWTKIEKLNQNRLKVDQNRDFESLSHVVKHFGEKISEQNRDSMHMPSRYELLTTLFCTKKDTPEYHYLSR